MNNDNKQTGNAELIAIANRRREELKRRQAAAAPKPQPQEQPPAEKREPKPRPQPKPSAAAESEALNRRRAAEARRLREEAELQRRAEEDARLAEKEAKKERILQEKRKKAEAARIKRDKNAARRRNSRKETAEAAAAKLHELQNNYKGTFKNAFAYFIVFLFVLLIICTLSATLYLLAIMNYVEKDPLPESVTFNAGGRDQRYEYAEIVRDGVYYLNFSAVAQLCDFSVSGDSETLIFSAENGEQIRFTPPSRAVTVNGNTVTASAEIIIIEKAEREIWVPVDLVRDYIYGITVTVDEGINGETGEPYLSIRVSRDRIGKEFAEIGFVLKYNSTLSGLSNESLPEEPVTLPDEAPVYEFAADLSGYMRYMCPEDIDRHMILINPSNALDGTYVPEDLLGVPNPRFDNGMSLCRDASMSLEALFLEMHTLGFRDMKVSIAYRSYEQQEYQFSVYTYNERYYYNSHYATEGKWFSDTAYEVLGKAYLEEKYISKGETSLSADDAKRVAMSYSAYPGTGDHQSGLALDLYLPGHSGTKFAETEEYAWLLENAHKFGFIFRYPKEKENITGYAFEPQHLRFVGQYHAAIIYETGLSLEEYVAKYID